MSWLFSRVLVEEYLPAKCLDGELSAQSNGNPIPQAYCAPDKTKDFLKVSRFGMTFKPLPENLGVELLTLYLEDFHARTLVRQEKAQELTEKPLECGEKWQGSFTKYDPNSLSWKTHQCSLLGDLDEFSETWPQWGLMRDGECWEQQTLEQTIKGIESGLSESKFPTPRAQEPGRTTIGYGRGLAELVEGKTQRMPKRSPDGMTTFHTPNTSGLDGGSNSRKALKKKLSTPVARMWKDNGQSPSELNRNSETLATQAGGSLNPTWVEWLMGWPLGWTDLKPLETDKSHCVQQQRGEF